ncbi:MAG: hypothetical protein PWP65_36 [Clostridia bacterium]|nr:hypothetical protein [Clostridia bacterium]
MMPVCAQWLALGGILFLGLIMGFLYDIYRTYRYLCRPGRLGSHVGDLFYWILATLLAFGFLMYLNWAEIRGYVFTGIFSGLIIYFAFLGKRVRPSLLRLGFFIKRWLRALARICSRSLFIILLPGRRLFLRWPRRPPPS